jgi:GNAT superfamily N-acetyltransferase
MATLQRTDVSNPDFRELVKLLDIDLQLSDGEEHAFFAQFNGTDNIKHVVVAYENGVAVGCGAFREFKEGTAEIKRMFVREDFRDKGIGKLILQELEDWVLELSFLRCILETGRNRPEAMAFYERNQYREISNFGPYQGVINSVCYEKVFVTG